MQIVEKYAFRFQLIPTSSHRPCYGCELFLGNFVLKLLKNISDNISWKGHPNKKMDLVGDSPIFEIIYSNLEQRSIFS